MNMQYESKENTDTHLDGKTVAGAVAHKFPPGRTEALDQHMFLARSLLSGPLSVPLLNF
jgi:hypothetical protein